MWYFWGDTAKQKMLNEKSKVGQLKELRKKPPLNGNS
jgi:peptide chain release factor